MRRNWTWSVAFVAATGLALSSCGGSSAAPPPQTVAPTAPRRAFDPPTRFDVVKAVRLPDEATGIALYTTKAFVAMPSNLEVIDTTTGKVINTITPDLKPADPADKPAAPKLAGIDGIDTVLVPMLVTVPGKGTKSARNAVEIIGVGARSAKRLWSVRVEIDKAGSAQPMNTAVVGVVGNIVVLRANGATYGVDIAAKKTVWSTAGFEAAAVTSAAVVGVTGDGASGQQVGSLNFADGTQRWVDARLSTGLNVQPGGQTFVLISGSDFNTGKSFYGLIDTSTGTAGQPVELHSPHQIICSYDDAATTACYTENWSGGFDSTTGNWLWKLPDPQADRVSITVTAAWHGAVYGVTDNGPVVLDARTGADLQPKPGAAPSVVNSYGGAGQHPTEAGLYAFTAVG